MKNLFLGFLALSFPMTILAQNTNSKTETTTTTSVMKDSDGLHKTVKKEVTKEVQQIELQPEQAGTKNIDMKDSPVVLTSTTKITNPDGSSRTVAIDHTGMYELNGKTYKVLLDARGYTMQYDKDKPAVLRTTSTNSYVYRTRNKTAVAYFDSNGNIIIETYDDKNDIILFEKYMFVGK
jgi:hypothetical protein